MLNLDIVVNLMDGKWSNLSTIIATLVTDESGCYREVRVMGRLGCSNINNDTCFFRERYNIFLFKD